MLEAPRKASGWGRLPKDLGLVRMLRTGTFNSIPKLPVSGEDLEVEFNHQWPII